MAQEKKLVDEVSGWLRLYDDGSVDRSWTGPPEVKFMAEPVPPHHEFINSVSVRDLVLDPELGLRVRIYLPEKPSEGHKYPILLHFHGGGFCISQADWFMYYTIYTRLAVAAGAVVVSPYLRHAPEHRLPASADDAFAALLWLRSLAESGDSENILPDANFGRIFLIGDSSGGNLVHEVAARAGREGQGPARLAGAVPIHPGFMRAERSRSEREKPQSPFLTLEMVDKFIGLALPVGSTKDHPMTCPMGEAAPPLDDVAFPPMLLCLTEEDLLIDTEMQYYEAMKRANKEIEIFMSHGMTHSFYLNKIAVDTDPKTAEETERLFSAIVEFIKKH